MVEVFQKGGLHGIGTSGKARRCVWGQRETPAGEIRNGEGVALVSGRAEKGLEMELPR